MRSLFISSVLTLHPSSNPIYDPSDFKPPNVSICEEADVRTPITDSMEYFANKITTEVVKNKNVNFVISPLSLSLTLHLAFFGARGSSKNYLMELLPLGESHPNIACIQQRGVKLLIEKLLNYSSTGLYTANGIFASSKLRMKEHYAGTIQSLGLTMRSVDFTDSEQTNRIIDEWGRRETKNLIPNISSSLYINNSTSLVFASAVYFKNIWLTKFDPKNTKDMPFRVNGIEKLKPTMSITGKFNYRKLKDFSFVELPYKSERIGYNISMFVVLPNDIDDRKNVMGQKFHENIRIDTLLARSRKTILHIELPKFRIIKDLDLQPYLSKIGNMNTLFDENRANFPISSTSPPLMFGKFVQSAIVEIDENGYEDVEPVDPIRRPINFKANHPFLIYIVTKDEYKMQVFVARYNGEEEET